MRYSKTEKSFIAFLLLILSFFSWLLYRDLTARIRAEGKVVGTITFKYNKVERKYQDQVIWEQLENSFPVINKDTIRTANVSDAELTLNDGTRIALNENSMIFVNVDEGKTTIGFNYGEVRTDQSAGNLEIKTGDKVVKVGEGSELKMAKKEDESLLVSVSKGAADFFSGGKTQKIGKDETAEVGKDSSDVKINKITLKMVSPGNGQRYFSGKEEETVAFAFSSEANQQIELEVAGDSSFGNVVLKKATNENRVTTGLPAGTYYWRIRSGKQTSETRKFFIMNIPGVNLVTPAADARIPVRGAQNFVNLIWQKNNMASSYRVEVSASDSFQNTIKSENSRMNSIAYSLSPGTYYWRVGSNSPAGKIVSYSQTRSFTIGGEEVLENLVLFNPRSGSSMFEPLIREKGITYNWSSRHSYKNYEFELSDTADFSKILKTSTTAAAFFRQNDPLASGSYYWRVRGVAANGKKGNYSRVGSFSVEKKAELVTILPAMNASLDEAAVQKNGIDFTWQKLPSRGQYRLYMAKDRGFGNITGTEVTSFDRLQLKTQAIGTMYWKVAFLNDAGKEILTSAVKQFSIQKQNIIPRPIYPGHKTSVMGVGTTLNFQWGTTENAKQYNVKLYSVYNKTKTILFNETSSTTGFSYDKLGTLKAGDYAWGLVATLEDGRKSSEVISHFRIVNNIILVSPGKKTSLSKSEQNRGIIFKWVKLPLPGKYRLMVSRNANFTGAAIQSVLVDGNFYHLRDMQPGLYYWKVSFVDSSQTESLTSLVSSVDIVDPEQKEEEKKKEKEIIPDKKTAGGFFPISPPDMDIVDPKRQKTIYFAWEKSQISNKYDLALYSLKDGKMTPVFKQRLNEETKFEFNNVKSLEKGEYLWNISSLNEKDEMLEEIYGSFRVDKDGESIEKYEYEDVEVLSPEVQYGE